MSFKENFTRLCMKQNEAPTNVCVKLGYSNATYSQWTDETVPRKSTLIKIADYFGVTVDDLLAEPQETKKSPSVSDEDIKFALFGGDEEVTPEMWDDVRKYVEFVKSKYGKK